MNKVYCSSNKGKTENIISVINQVLKKENIHKKPILIKPNMVDPNIPEACSNPETIETVSEVLRNNGCGNIFIGDEPAKYVFDKEGDNFKEWVSNLEYDKIRGVMPLNLRAIPTRKYQSVTINPDTGEYESNEIGIRDTRKLFVVNLTLPKQHGNFNFSGSTKNLMGLIPYEQRMNNFHRDFNFQDLENFFSILNRLKIKHGYLMEKYYEPVEGLFFPEKKMPQKDFDDLVYSHVCHIEHLINMPALKCLKDEFERNQKGIHLIDGTYTMIKHEHDGELATTNFVYGAKDSGCLDLVTLNSIGIIKEDVPYINFLTEQTPETIGVMASYHTNNDVLMKEVFKKNGNYALRIKDQ